MKNKCISTETLETTVRLAKVVKIDENIEWEMTANDIVNMLETFSSEKITESGKLRSKQVKGKLDALLEKLSSSKSKDLPKFIETLKTSKDEKNDPSRVLRHQSMGIKLIMDTIKGEFDKADKYGVPLDSIADSNGIPNIPLHRLAATLGRKIYFSEGFRFKKRDNESVNNAGSVEHSYYRVGLTALNNLQDNGFINLIEPGKADTILDFIEEGKNSINYSKRVTNDVAALTINLDAFKDSISEKKKHGILNSYSEMLSVVSEDYMNTVSAVDLLSSPRDVKKPATEYSKLEQVKRNAYEPGDTLSKVKKELESNPVYLQEDIHSFYSLLHKTLKDSPESASQFIQKKIHDPIMFNQLFGVELNNPIDSDADSFKGRNLSKTTPINDLIEYFEDFDGDKPASLFMAMFAGKNARLYVDNNVINPHASKLMRHSLSVKEYEVEENSDVYKYFINKLADDLGGDQKRAVIDGILGTTATKDGKRIEVLLENYRDFKEAETLSSKITALTHMSKAYPNLDFGSLVSIAKAVADVRAVSNGKLKTTYMVSSDATASGAQLTFMQALGNAPKGITKLMQQLKIFKGEAESDIKDVYGLLQRELEGLVNNKPSKNLQARSENYSMESIAATVGLLKEDLYKDMRDLAKSPTMTFVYDQSKGGAVDSLSTAFTDKVIEHLRKNKTPAGSVLQLLNMFGIEYSNKIGKDKDLKVKLKTAFKESNVPAFLYETLTDVITNKYLEEHKRIGKEIFNLVKDNVDVKQFKVLPASTVLDRAAEKSPSKLSKTLLDTYGIPMTKSYWTANTVNGDTVLTQKEILAATVMNVSFIHSADTANMYHALKGLPGRYDTGVVTVHDDARSRADLVMEFDQNYIDTNLEVALNYDIHEQVLEAAAVYNPSLLGIEKYTNLLEQVKAAKKAKQDLLKDEDHGYNSKTGSIIGDRDSFIDFTKESDSTSEVRSEDTSGKASTNTSAEETASVPVSNAQEKAVKVLKSLAAKSDLVKGFLESKNSSNIEFGENSKFDPSKDTITISDSDIDKVEHEIVHSYTTASIKRWYLGDNPNNQDFKTIEKAVDKLAAIKDLSDEASSRVNYILSKQDPASRMAEFISVMYAEPKIASEIYNKIESSTPLNKIVEVVRRVVKRIRTAISTGDLSEGLDVAELYNAINNVVDHGKLQRELNIELVKQLQKEFDKPLYYNGPMKALTKATDSINYAVSRPILASVEFADGKLKSADTLLSKYSAYRTVRNYAAGIYDDSETLQSIMHKITNGNINQLKKNEILSLHHKIEGDKNEITSQQLQRFKEAQRNLSEAQKEAFYDFTQKMSIADYFEYGEGYGNLDTAIETLKSKLGEDRIKKLDGVVEFNTNKDYVPGKDTIYNIEAAGFGKSDLAKIARRYVVLRSIQELGEDRFNNLISNEALMAVVRDNVLANAQILATNPVIKTDQLRDNNLVDQFKNNPVFKVVTLKNLKDYDQKGSGWKVLRRPTANTVGVIYQTPIDGTFQSGVFTGISNNSGDINVDSSLSKYSDVVPVGDSHKVILSQSEKEAAGLIKDPSQSIVRSMAHNLAIQDSEIIRSKLLEETTYFELTKSNENSLINKIKDKTQETPWLLKSDEDLNYEDLPKEIKAKYMRVPVKLSNVDGFDERVQLVRKDISYWLVGASEGSIVNDPKLQMALRITKDLISGTKIGMVVLNPVKIFKDNVFNAMYLSVLGVDPVTMAKNYKAIMTEFNEYQDMKHRMNKLRIMSYSDPERVKPKMDALAKQMREHPSNGLVERGFINSLGSEIILNDDDPGAGFKSDIDKVLKKLLQDKDGNNNAVGKHIMKMANTSVGVETTLQRIADIFSHARSTKEVESEISRMAKNIEMIKKEEDVVAYMHQFINSPNSEFVKFGSHMTDLTDVLAKETYFRSLKSRRMSEDKATTEVIAAFPDYKEGLPTKVHQLDQVGILMFPQYWMRMIQAMLRLAGHRPVSFGTEVAVSNMLDSNSQLWEQTLIYKANSRWGLLHNPADHIGYGSIIPTHAL